MKRNLAYILAKSTGKTSFSGCPKDNESPAKLTESIFKNMARNEIPGENKFLIEYNTSRCSFN
jgi:hypothetical protein